MFSSQLRSALIIPACHREQGKIWNPAAESIGSDLQKLTSGPCRWRSFPGDITSGLPVGLANRAGSSTGSRFRRARILRGACGGRLEKCSTWNMTIV